MPVDRLPYRPGTGTFRKKTFGYRSHMGTRGYSTPEKAALSSYSDAADAFVVCVTTDPVGREMGRDRVKVEIDTDPSHPYFITCERGEDGLWYELFGHN